MDFALSHVPHDRLGKFDAGCGQFGIRWQFNESGAYFPKRHNYHPAIFRLNQCGPTGRFIRGHDQLFKYQPGASGLCRSDKKDGFVPGKPIDLGHKSQH